MVIYQFIRYIYSYNITEIVTQITTFTYYMHCKLFKYDVWYN